MGVHGCDLARATGQAYEVDEASLELVRALVVHFAPADDPEQPVVNDGTLPFGPAVEVPAGAPTLDHVVAPTGRAPPWQPAGPAVPPPHRAADARVGQSGARSCESW